MHLRQLTVAFLFALLIAPTSQLYGQTAAAKPSALSILLAAQRSCGWGSQLALTSVLATGQVTRSGEGATGTVPITLKVAGRQAMRIELGDGSLTTTVVNNGQAAVSTASGVQRLSTATARALRPVYFPFLMGFTDNAAVAAIWVYQGTEAVNGVPAYRIAAQLPAGVPQTFLDSLAVPLGLVIWVAVEGNLPLKIRYSIPGYDNPSARLIHERLFADYRQVNGVAVPFRQDDVVFGQTVSSLQLSQVSLGAQLSATDFIVPASADATPN